MTVVIKAIALKFPAEGKMSVIEILRQPRVSFRTQWQIFADPLTADQS